MPVWNVPIARPVVLLLVAFSRTIVPQNNLQKNPKATQLYTTGLVCTYTSEENIVLLLTGAGYVGDSDITHKIYNVKCEVDWMNGSRHI